MERREEERRRIWGEGDCDFTDFAVFKAMTPPLGSSQHYCEPKTLKRLLRARNREMMAL